MKIIKLKTKWHILSLSVLLIAFSLVGCNSTKDSFKYVDATVDDLSGKEFEVILIRNFEDPDKSNMMMIIGDIDKADKIVGHKIKADKIIDASWVEHLASGFVKAERIKRGYLDDSRAIFLTRTKGYVIKIATDDKVVYGPDYQSEQLRKDFEEIGLLGEYSNPPDMNKVIKALK
ncbi:MAG: hypothetical protein PHP01_08455 [Phycisphaerae bacterium]|nr:hypothetical protein [Phycisphaerae bacterium]